MEMEIAALNLPRDTGKRAGLQHLQLTKTSLVLTIRNPFQTILGGKGRRRGFTIIHRCLTTSSGRMKTRNTRAIRNKSSNLSFRFILSPSPSLSPPPPCPSLSEALGLLLSARVQIWSLRAHPYGNQGGGREGHNELERNLNRYVLPFSAAQH